MPKNALILLADGFEEIEAVSPIDLLRRAEVDVTIASCSTKTLVEGRSGISIQSDCILDEVKGKEFDLLVLPGGPAVFELRKDKSILELIQKYYEERKWIGAICAAPILLLDSNILGNSKYTAHVSMIDDLPALIPDKEVVRDGTIITSSGAGTAIAFGLALIEALEGRNKAKETANSIHAPF